MRLIKMTGGLGNQMFIYAMYLCSRGGAHVLTPARWSAKYDTPYINCPSWTLVPTVG